MTISESMIRHAHSLLAKLKHLLRKAGERTREGLWNLIGSLLDDFPPQQCNNYFRYDPV